MINQYHEDTIICQTGGNKCKNLLSKGWAKQSSFYMFIKMDNYKCKISNATDDTRLAEFENTAEDHEEEEKSRTSDQQISPNSSRESCVDDWFQVGVHCYKIVSHEGPRTIKSYDETCANMYATLAVFTSGSHYNDFYKQWKTLSNFQSSNLLLGYTHNRGEPDFNDIFSYYNQNKMSFPNYFLPPNADFWNNNEYCIHMKPNLSLYCLNDVSCSFPMLKPVCEQRIKDNLLSVNCAKLCRSKTSNGHRLTTHLKYCKVEASIETTEPAFAFVRFTPGLCGMIYEMKSQETGNTLIVYGQKGISSLDVSYVYQRSIIVAKVRASVNMDQYVLMIIPQRDDTIICKNNSDEHKSLLTQSWKVQQSFFLFNQRINSECRIIAPSVDQLQTNTNATNQTSVAVPNACNWTEWKTLTTCNTTCGKGYETKIRFGTCKGLQNRLNEIVTIPCFIAECRYQQKACGQVLESKPGVVKTAFAVESLCQCGKACNFYSWCTGVNFRPPNGSTANCELLRKNSSTESFTCAVGWTFYEKF